MSKVWANDSSRLRWRRLAATAIDALLLSVTALLIMLVTGLMETADAYVWPQPLVRMTALIVICYLILNAHGLLTRGQTPGKRMLGVRIEHVTGVPLSSALHVVRTLGVVLLTIVAIFIAGGGALILFAVDVLFVFGARERCLHDYLAASRVVKAD
ncbi:MAG: RDD family protein [Pseudomonadales bacterium]|jgi:uncharacterized RDD family membrane protein YckC|nr:RDD family protein [Pseudomonadales bacterium]MDP6472381.1 RDD family protein [Pseudomonadales bacterium]MDP6828177.1 RDD family protein [Pseudomonadales bacterium]MDP6970255.1 RDD family protein [Pseudomonadales bacterium]|tara:strand:- start:1444 stop:1911 length:468 start_codon:yes stop_codon:yes gene_type:complete